MSAAEEVRGLELVGHLTRLVLGPPAAPQLSGVGWRSLLNLAVRERCAALAWTRAGSLISAHAPPDTSTAWRQLYITISARGHAQIAAAADVADRLHRAGVHPVTLKGFPLAAALYGDGTCRACTDIDWFVNTVDRDKTRRVLAAEGWTHSEGGLPWDETYARQSPHGMMYIEVHSSLMHPRFSYLPVPSPEHESMLVEGVAVRRQAGALLPSYLAAHLAQHASPPLLWDIDFTVLWSGLADADRIAARRSARKAGLGRYLAWAERRAGRVRRLAAGRIREGVRLGFTATGRRDVHPVWRHTWLSPSPAAAARALDCWVRPSWVREEYGPGVRGALRRVAKHWRSALASEERVGDGPLGDGFPKTADLTRGLAALGVASPEGRGALRGGLDSEHRAQDSAKDQTVRVCSDFLTPG